MSKFFAWLTTSSADPSKVALTIKGVLGTVVSLVVFISPLVHLNLGADQLNAIADGVVQAVVAFLGLVSVLATIAGFIRKIKINPTIQPVVTIPGTTQTPSV